MEVNLHIYRVAESTKNLFIFTAREADQKLVGYEVFFCYPHPHFKASLQAKQDVLFLHPDFRGSGMKFLAWNEAELRSAGIQLMCRNETTQCRYGLLLKRQGFRAAELVWEKRLDQGGK